MLSVGLQCENNLRWLTIHLHFLSQRKTRDELSHNIFLMLQECNKFREHQARENLIELLEKQLAARRKLIKELLVNIEKSDSLLRPKADGLGTND